MTYTHHLTTMVDAHYSPDDGGWYLFNYKDGRASVELWQTFAAARQAFEENAVTWEEVNT